MKTYQEIKPPATIETIIYYAETLFGIRFMKVKMNRYNGLCPFHADTASLRRELVGLNYLQRARGLYWRAEEKET